MLWGKLTQNWNKGTPVYCFAVFYICYCSRTILSLPRLINISTKPKKLNQLIKCYAFVNSIGHFVISRWICVPHWCKANYVLRHTTLHSADVSWIEHIWNKTKRSMVKFFWFYFYRFSHFPFIFIYNFHSEYQSNKIWSCK